MSNKSSEDSLLQPGYIIEEQTSNQAPNEILGGEGCSSLKSEVGFGPNQTSSRDVFVLLEQ